MQAETVCFAALPASLPAPWARPAEAGAGEDVQLRGLRLAGLDEAGGEIETEARVLAPRVLTRLFREAEPAGSAAQRAVETADTLVILLPIGRYDDGVWAPILARILRGVSEAANRPRAIVLAWSGIEPFLAPFGDRAAALWGDPRLAGAMLDLLERQARSLAAVLAEIGGETAIRRGLVRFEHAEADASLRAALVLA